MKVRVKGIEEKRNLVQIAFLELKKYKPEMQASYNKVRWMELFGNKPFTHQPGNIITKADRILDVKEWNKEDKAMFDEYIRAWDGWNAHLAYVEEAQEQAKEQGLEQGLQRGLQQGREEGRLGTLIDLVTKGVITKEYACEELGVSEKEFEKYL